MPFTITPEHEAIFAAVRSGSAGGNIQIESVAGSGKTSTICEALRCLPVTSTDSLLAPATCFITFSRPTADALRARVPSHVQATTFNSLGHRALSTAFPDSRKHRDWLDARKCSKILYTLGERQNPDFQNILRLVSLLKSIPPFKDEMFYYSVAHNFIKQHDLVLEEEQQSVQMAVTVLLKSNAMVEECIDFNDQLYLPVLLDLEFSAQDFVFVDEAQDCNEIQLEILERLAQPKRWFLTGLSGPKLDEVLKSPTFFCFVGDPYQAIYGFRGAGTDSMSLIRSRFSCRTFSLSVSYRCPRAVVREAQKWMKGAL